MKTYRALAYKELLASKITSVLILIAGHSVHNDDHRHWAIPGYSLCHAGSAGHCAEWEPICDVCSDGSGAGG